MKIRPINAAVLFFVFAVVADWLSSFYGMKVPGVQESNPFYRNEAMMWVWHKAVVGDGIQLAVLLILACVIWKVGNQFRQGYGEAMASVPLVGFAFHRLWEAVIPNIELALNFFVPSKIPNIFQ